jgi:hypothetical protein
MFKDYYAVRDYFKFGPAAVSDTNFTAKLSFYTGFQDGSTCRLRKAEKDNKNRDYFQIVRFKKNK